MGIKIKKLRRYLGVERVEPGSGGRRPSWSHSQAGRCRRIWGRWWRRCAGRRAGPRGPPGPSTPPSSHGASPTADNRTEASLPLRPESNQLYTSLLLSSPGRSIKTQKTLQPPQRVWRPLGLDSNQLYSSQPLSSPRCSIKTPKNKPSTSSKGLERPRRIWSLRRCSNPFQSVHGAPFQIGSLLLGRAIDLGYLKSGHPTNLFLQWQRKANSALYNIPVLSQDPRQTKSKLAEPRLLIRVEVGMYKSNPVPLSKEQEMIPSKKKPQGRFDSKIILNLCLMLGFFWLL